MKKLKILLNISSKFSNLDASIETPLMIYVIVERAAENTICLYLRRNNEKGEGEC